MQKQTAITGLEHITRYWDPSRNTTCAKLKPGEYYVTPGDEQMVTVVGSAVAVYVFDSKRNAAGMTHFALPARRERENAFDILAYGEHALELLLRGVWRQGARRENTKAILLGGGALWNETARARASLNFARRFLEDHGVEIVDEAVGFTNPCKVWTSPEGGESIRLRLLGSYNSTIQWREDSYYHELEEWMDDDDSDVSCGRTVIREHVKMMRDLAHLEETARRAIAEPKVWFYPARDAIAEIRRTLPAHFKMEEESFYVEVAQQHPRFAGQLQMLRKEHGVMTRRLAMIDAALALPNAQDNRDLTGLIADTIEMLRQHEADEGEILMRTYTEELGGG